MTLLVADCPRCGAKSMTFEIRSYSNSPTDCEAFCICRNCHKATIFVLSVEITFIDEAEEILASQGSINQFFENKGPITLKDNCTKKPPDHIPKNIAAVFEEAATCLMVHCYNAAGTMFRLCVDLATKTILPAESAEEPNSATRRSLGQRLKWLFEKGLLPLSLKDLSLCIKEDGNDAAHEGTIKKEEAEDMADFTFLLLEKIFTEPKRIELAKQRREGRRS